MSRAQLTSTVEQNTGGAVAPFLAGKNKIINGDFGIWARGTSFATSSNQYNADRWTMLAAGAYPTGTVSQQAFTPGTAPVAGYEGTYFCRVNITANNNALAWDLIQKVEDVKTFANQTVTFSFWAKADAAASNFQVYLEQNFGTGGSASVFSVSGGISITSSWARYTYTVALPSISGKTIGTGSYLNVALRMPSSTYVRVGTYDIWGVQVEAGSVATPFTTASGTLQGELALCQRYHERSFSNDATVAAGKIGCYSDSNYTAGMRWQVTKRATPSVTLYSTNGGTAGNVRQSSTNTNYAIAGFGAISIYGFDLITGVGRSNLVDFHYVADSEL